MNSDSAYRTLKPSSSDQSELSGHSELSELSDPTEFSGHTPSAAVASLRAEVRSRHPLSPHFILSCHRDDYAASRIVRAVEDCDVHLLHLEAIPHPDSPESFFMVSLATAPCNPSHIVASLERYGYEVTDVDSPLNPAEDPGDDDPLRERVASLLRLFDV